MTETNPTPVTLDRVAEIFQAENLEYVPEEHGLLRTGFPNAAVGVVMEGDYLLFDASWRGTPAADSAPHVLAAVNEWNLTQIMPSLSFSEIQQGTLNLRAHRAMYIGHGATRNQIGAFIMSTIENTLACFNWLEKQFPKLVTWEEQQ
ncbi:MAG: YbjN domain-containing protein [Corynebacterium sp.]|nr:YbjN domain-containing protein [Corynebacterium sp.]